MYMSKELELKKLAKIKAQHEAVLKSFEETPPRLPQEHRSRQFSEKRIEQLQHQINALINNS